MDATAWAALGTWAAVVVALAISLRDIIQKRSERKAEAQILATLIYSDLRTMSVRIQNVVARIPEDQLEFQQLEATLATNRADRKTLGVLGEGLVSPVLDKSVDRLFALPKEFSQHLAHAIAATSQLRDTLLSVRDEENNDVAREQYGKLLPILKQHAKAANEKVNKALLACHSLIP